MIELITLLLRLSAKIKVEKHGFGSGLYIFEGENKPNGGYCICMHYRLINVIYYPCCVFFVDNMTAVFHVGYLSINKHNYVIESPLS